MLFILSQDGKRLFPVADLHILSLSEIEVEPSKTKYTANPEFPYYTPTHIVKPAKLTYLITSTGMGTLGVFKTKEKRDEVFEEMVIWLANDGTYIPFSDRPNFVIQDKVFRMPIEEE